MKRKIMMRSSATGDGENFADQNEDGPFVPYDFFDLEPLRFALRCAKDANTNVRILFTHIDAVEFQLKHGDQEKPERAEAELKRTRVELQRARENRVRVRVRVRECEEELARKREKELTRMCAEAELKRTREELKCVREKQFTLKESQEKLIREEEKLARVCGEDDTELKHTSAHKEENSPSGDERSLLKRHEGKVKKFEDAECKKGAKKNRAGNWLFGRSVDNEPAEISNLQGLAKETEPTERVMTIKEIEGLQRTIKELRVESKRLVGVNMRQASTLSGRNEKIESLEHAKKDQASANQEEYAQFKKQQVELNRIIDELRAKIEKLEKELESANGKNKNFQKGSAKLEADIVRLKEHLREAEGKLETMAVEHGRTRVGESISSESKSRGSGWLGLFSRVEAAQPGNEGEEAGANLV